MAPKVLYTGTKNFWRTRTVVEFKIIDHPMEGVIEIMAAKADDMTVHAPCVYISSSKLFAKLSQSDVETSAKKKYDDFCHGMIKSRSLFPPDFSFFVHEVELDMSVEFILARLTIPLGGGFQLQLRSLIGDPVDDAGNLDIICGKPPTLSEQHVETSAKPRQASVGNWESFLRACDPDWAYEHLQDELGVPLPPQFSQSKSRSIDEDGEDGDGPEITRSHRNWLKVISRLIWNREVENMRIRVDIWEYKQSEMRRLRKQRSSRFVIGGSRAAAGQRRSSDGSLKSTDTASGIFSSQGNTGNGTSMTPNRSSSTMFPVTVPVPMSEEVAKISISPGGTNPPVGTTASISPATPEDKPQRRRSATNSSLKAETGSGPARRRSVGSDFPRSQQAHQDRIQRQQTKRPSIGASAETLLLPNISKESRRQSAAGSLMSSSPQQRLFESPSSISPSLSSSLSSPSQPPLDPDSERQQTEQQPEQSSELTRSGKSTGTFSRETKVVAPFAPGKATGSDGDVGGIGGIAPLVPGQGLAQRRRGSTASESSSHAAASRQRRGSGGSGYSSSTTNTVNYDEDDSMRPNTAARANALTRRRRGDEGNAGGTGSGYNTAGDEETDKGSIRTRSRFSTPEKRDKDNKDSTTASGTALSRNTERRATLGSSDPKDIARVVNQSTLSAVARRSRAANREEERSSSSSRTRTDALARISGGMVEASRNGRVNKRSFTDGPQGSSSAGDKAMGASADTAVAAVGGGAVALRVAKDGRKRATGVRVSGSVDHTRSPPVFPQEKLVIPMAREEEVRRGYDHAGEESDEDDESAAGTHSDGGGDGCESNDNSDDESDISSDIDNGSGYIVTGGEDGSNPFLADNTQAAQQVQSQSQQPWRRLSTHNPDRYSGRDAVAVTLALVREALEPLDGDADADVDANESKELQEKNNLFLHSSNRTDVRNTEQMHFFDNDHTKPEKLLNAAENHIDGLNGQRVHVTTSATLPALVSVNSQLLPRQENILPKHHQKSLQGQDIATVSFLDITEHANTSASRRNSYHSNSTGNSDPPASCTTTAGILPGDQPGDHRSYRESPLSRLLAAEDPRPSGAVASLSDERRRHSLSGFGQSTGVAPFQRRRSSGANAQLGPLSAATAAAGGGHVMHAQEVVLENHLHSKFPHNSTPLLSTTLSGNQSPPYNGTSSYTSSNNNSSPFAGHSTATAAATLLFNGDNENLYGTESSPLMTVPALEAQPPPGAKVSGIVIVGRRNSHQQQQQYDAVTPDIPHDPFRVYGRKQQQQSISISGVFPSIVGANITHLSSGIAEGLPSSDPHLLT